MGGSASGESGCLLQKSFFKSLISLGPLQASSGSSDYQLLVLPGSLGLVGYQFWVPPACAAFGDIWFLVATPLSAYVAAGQDGLHLALSSGARPLLVGVLGGWCPVAGMEASCPPPPIPLQVHLSYLAIAELYPILTDP